MGCSCSTYLTSRQGPMLRTEIRKSRVPFSAPRPNRLATAMTALQANFPNMTISFVGYSRSGSVRVTASTVPDLTSQAPDLKELHYLLVKLETQTNAQPDIVTVEFGTPQGIGRLQSFEGWFRRIKNWDVHVTARSANAQDADRLLTSTLSVLRGHKISATRVLAISIMPALSEILGLATLVGLAFFGFEEGGKLTGLALLSLFYWRLAFFVKPPRAYIFLQAPRSWRSSGLLRWSPSPRAQALWTVVGGLAGLIALVVAILAWLAPKS